MKYDPTEYEREDQDSVMDPNDLPFCNCDDEQETEPKICRLCTCSVHGNYVCEDCDINLDLWGRDNGYVP
jgi:hypothetical protein